MGGRIAATVARYQVGKAEKEYNRRRGRDEVSIAGVSKTSGWFAASSARQLPGAAAAAVATARRAQGAVRRPRRRRAGLQPPHRLSRLPRPLGNRRAALPGARRPARALAPAPSPLAREAGEGQGEGLTAALAPLWFVRYRIRIVPRAPLALRRLVCHDLNLACRACPHRCEPPPGCSATRPTRRAKGRLWWATNCPTCRVGRPSASWGSAAIAPTRALSGSGRRKASASASKKNATNR